jgi:hypothetical protein
VLLGLLELVAGGEQLGGDMDRGPKDGNGWGQSEGRGRRRGKGREIYVRWATVTMRELELAATN